LAERGVYGIEAVGGKLLAHRTERPMLTLQVEPIFK